MKPETVFDQLFFTTIHLQDGDGGMGTGFFYSVPVEGGGQATFIVTNRHVLKDVKGLTLRPILRKADGSPNLSSERPIRLDDFDTNSWHGHPDDEIDVAVIPISGLIERVQQVGFAMYFRSITPELIPTDDQIGELDSVVDVRFVGYPSGIYDSANSLPIMRRGTSASYLQVDYDGKPTFLIDASVFPGSSGSPVFLVETGARPNRKGDVMIGQPTVYLLGIVAAMKLRHVTGELVETSTKIVSVSPEGIDLGIVYKSRTIDECVDSVLEKAGVKRTARQMPPVTTPALTQADQKIADRDNRGSK